MKLSVQLYTVRDSLESDYRGTLATLREIGLNYVELAGNYGESPESTKALLDELGLKVSGSHVGLGVMEDDLQKVIDIHNTFECKNIILPWLGGDDYKDGWEAVAARVKPLAEKLTAAGFRFLYHNHAFEFENEGKPGLDVFYDSLPADLVYAEFDLAWIKIGGQDPAEYITRYGKRAPLLHLKDFDPTQDPQWVPAGTGTVDFDAIFAAAEATGAEFGAIELDLSAIDPLVAVKQSYEFFKSKGLS